MAEAWKVQPRQVVYQALNWLVKNSAIKNDFTINTNWWHVITTNYLPVIDPLLICSLDL